MRHRGGPVPSLVDATSASVLERAAIQGEIINTVTYDRDRPWDSVFRAAARNDRYWDREVRRPALAFLARGSTTATPMITQPVLDAMAGITGHSGGGRGGGDEAKEGTKRQATQGHRSAERRTEQDGEEEGQDESSSSTWW